MSVGTDESDAPNAPDRVSLCICVSWGLYYRVKKKKTVRIMSGFYFLSIFVWHSFFPRRLNGNFPFASHFPFISFSLLFSLWRFFCLCFWQLQRWKRQERRSCGERDGRMSSNNGLGSSSAPGRVLPRWGWFNSIDVRYKWTNGQSAVCSRRRSEWMRNITLMLEYRVYYITIGKTRPIQAV